MSGGNLFTVATAWDETTKRRERAMVAKCSKCPRQATVADNAGMARPMTYFADRFRRKGWRLGARATAHVCPQCVVGIKAKPDLSPAQKRAAFCRIADVPRAAASTNSATPKEASMTKTAKAPVPAPTLTVVADAPCQPGRDDIRAILDALGDCYLVDKGCYAKGDSDDALAKRLNVPRAWVTAERDRAFGPDACEDDSKDAASLATLSADLKRWGEEALDLAGRYDAKHREVEALRLKLAKRGVA